MILSAEERDNKVTARFLRKSGFTPGVVYGKNEGTQMISLNSKEFCGLCNSVSFFNKVYTLSINGKKRLAIPREVQRHPVTDNVVHVDFQYVAKNSKIRVFIPLIVVNSDKSPGVKRGGIVNVIVHSVEIITAVSDIPEIIEINLTGLELNQSIYLENIALPKGVSVFKPERYAILATVVPPKGFSEDKQGSTEESTGEESKEDKGA
ncbi:MAG: 50S ribosomal protein L25/general stress protein Ctc [Alphaproteobacteria bacterium]